MRDFYFSAIILSFFMAIVFLLQNAGVVNPAYSPGAEWWKFILSIFGHADGSHLYNNLFFLLMFGTVLELKASSKVFLYTFMGSALVANLSVFIFYSESAIIGASGGAVGVLAALAAYRPRDIGLALWVPLPMWAVLLSYILINFAGLTGSSNVAYEAHLIGLFVGLGSGYYLRERGYLSEGVSGEEDEDLDNWEQRIRDWERKYMLEEGE